MRILSLILLLFLLPANACLSQEIPRQAMVMTFAETADGVGNNVELLGSGILIDLHGHILTSASALGMGEATRSVRVRVALNNSQEDRVTAQVVVCGEKDVDVCLIKVAASQVQRAGIASVVQPWCNFIAQGSPMEVFGYPNSRIRELARDTGDITTDLGAALKYRASARVADGMGGGPVFVGGRLVALATGTEVSSGLAVIQPLLYARNIIEMTGGECGQLSAELAAGLTAGSTPTERLYDIVALPLGEQHFNGFRNFAGRCPAGSYVDGIKLYSTTHEACNGCLISAELLCRPLLQ